MNVYSLPSFDRAFRKLTAAEQSLVCGAAERLPDAFGKPHVHAGIGIRRIKSWYEFRAGLKLRVLFRLNEGDAFLAIVGNHDEIARFIRDNA